MTENKPDPEEISSEIHDIKAQVNAIRESLVVEFETRHRYADALDVKRIESAVRLKVVSEIQEEIVNWIKRRGWMITVVIVVLSFFGTRLLVEFMVQQRVFDLIIKDTSQAYAELNDLKSESVDLLSQINGVKSEIEALSGALPDPEAIKRMSVSLSEIPQLKETLELEDVRIEGVINRKEGALSNWIFLSRVENIHTVYRFISETKEINADSGLTFPSEIPTLAEFERNQNIKVLFMVTRRPLETYQRRLARAEQAMYDLITLGYHSEVWIFGDKDDRKAQIEDDLSRAIEETSLSRDAVLRCKQLCLVTHRSVAINERVISKAMLELAPNAHLNRVLEDFELDASMLEVRDYNRAFPLTKFIRARDARIVLVGELPL